MQEKGPAACATRAPANINHTLPRVLECLLRPAAESAQTHPLEHIPEADHPSHHDPQYLGTVEKFQLVV